MKRRFKFFTLSFFCFYMGFSQEILKKHTVSDGETLLSISKKYNVTPFDLQKANPGAIEGIKMDDVLIIPESKIITPKLESAADSIKASVVSSSISHTVKSGETKFGLSKRYGLTMQQLESQNPQITSGLTVGQVLEIYPSKTQMDVEVQPQPNRNLNEERSLKEGKTHIVSAGETLFKIASVNGLTVDQLEKANSNTISGMLKIGQVLWIPGDNEQTTSENSVNYIVKYGDTKFSLSRRFNTSIREMERQNPHISKMLIVGQTITMSTNETSNRNSQVTPSESSTNQPVAPIDKTQVVEEVIVVSAVPSEAPAEELKEEAAVVTNDHSEVIAQEKKEEERVSTSTVKEASSLPKSTSNYTDLRTSANTSQPKRVLFFLPFSQMEYQDYAVKQDNFEEVSDDFKRIHLEFYKGANIAIDSIRKMNFNVDIDVLQAQSTNQTSKIKSLMEEKNIKNYDAVILPFYKTVEEEVAAFTADSNTPVITTSAIALKSNTKNLFSALPSINQQRLKVLNHMMAKKAHIIVLSDVNRIESKLVIANHVPLVDFIDLKKNGSFSERELVSKFKKGQLNYVIIDSERNSVFLNATSVLLGEMSNYNLQLAVLDSSLIPDDGDVSQKRYRILKMIFPSLIPAKSTESSKQFLSAYQNKYNLLPSANIMLGFDITFDSLLRLMQQQSFENSATTDITEYTQLKFNYEKNNTLGGYSNEGIYILQYDSDANIRDAN